MRAAFLTVLTGILINVAPGAAHEFAVEESVITPGESLTGVLEAGDHVMNSDDTYFDTYILPVSSGRTYQISLDSEDFDAYLMLSDYVTGDFADDDDSGAGRNAMLARAAEGDGFYVLRVNSVEKAVGSYTLRVQELVPAP